MNEAAFVQDYSRWPRWPLLPLKHRTKPFTEPDALGLLFAQEAPPYRVYVNANLIAVYLTKSTTWADALAGLNVQEFATIELLLQHWKVD